MMRIIVLFAFVLLSGCSYHRYRVVARSEYIDANYLASRRIETPDPCQKCFQGQQIVVSWNIPSRYLPAEIVLDVRYGDHSFASFSYPVEHPQGARIYRLLNEEFWRLGGVISYCATISHEEVVLDQWKHHIWADLIEVPISTD